ncbi:transcription elongation factor greB [Acinetobacter rudis CIP 110305]|uniref:Transcription elongation factor GreA n=1 Tax=Acinetobacter rudis CIP 110305 TaxID=421052 RepID=S3MUY6_9GAMM|nr:transcription elongation factor greB [Acinetobacter rudis CIP 110305]
MNRKLLTAEGYQRLQDELNDLVRKERPEITKIVSWAASLGDRSENADSEIYPLFLYYQNNYS